MPAWTNPVTVTVVEELDVSSASLSASATRVTVGETVEFTVTAQLNRAPDIGEARYMAVWADFYVNDTREASASVPLQAGVTTYTLRWSRRFDAPGTYTVKAYVYIGPMETGTAPSPAPAPTPVAVAIASVEVRPESVWTNPVRIIVEPAEAAAAAPTPALAVAALLAAALLAERARR